MSGGLLDVMSKANVDTGNVVDTARLSLALVTSLMAESEQKILFHLKYLMIIRVRSEYRKVNYV